MEDNTNGGCEIKQKQKQEKIVGKLNTYITQFSSPWALVAKGSHENSLNTDQ